ncbi:MAG: Rho termination factor N-terminal domain-containing protein, partial [Peptococcaceae bacterium]|nr:Rho termination factor N-terminal domain-containing protein [Peptococcaceae bacterium]
MKLPKQQEDIENKTMAELYQIARDLELSGYSRLRKSELIFEIRKAQIMKDNDPEGV